MLSCCLSLSLSLSPPLSLSVSLSLFLSLSLSLMQYIYIHSTLSFIHYTSLHTGTIALELLAQVPQLDVVVVPIGGGGMCSGGSVNGH